jgi:archaellum biogenesis ATPase FlaH
MNQEIDFMKGLHPQNTTFYLGAFSDAGPISGGLYDDTVKAIQDAMVLDQNPNVKNVYVSTQPVKNYLPSQALNLQVNGCRPPKNEDIERLKNYFIDIDPVRPSGTIASDDQVSQVKNARTQLLNYLSLTGFPEMLEQFSGNGIQMFGKIDLEVSDVNIQVLKGATATLAKQYGTDQVKFDLAIYNPARLCRCPGTTNRKGEQTGNLFHRKCTVLNIPNVRIAIDLDWLHRIAAQSSLTHIEQILLENTSDNGILQSSHTPKFNLEWYLSHYGITVVKVVDHGDAKLYVLAKCLFNVSHGFGEAAIGQRADGTMFYKCFHDSCQMYHWKDARIVISGNVSINDFFEDGKGVYGEMTGSVISMAELVKVDFPPAEPLIENIVSVGGATIISGAGGVGKSTLALLFALVLANDRINAYLGLHVAHHAPTLLIQSENAAADTKDRLLTMGVYAELKEGLGHVYSLTQNFSDIRILDGDFNSDQFFKRVLNDVRTTGAGLLIIDPLISFYRGDENDNSTVRRFLDRLTLLMSLTGISIIIIHHVGREYKSSFSNYAGRGASAVGDWAHNTFLLRTIDHKTGTLELSCQKARNFKKPEPIQLKLNEHMVFELVNTQGGFSKALQLRIVTDALNALGGTVSSQKALIEEVLKANPNINATKAHGIIKDAVHDGSIIEGGRGRTKTYSLPQQQQQALPDIPPSPHNP